VAEQQAQLDRRLEAFKTEQATGAARGDRIRQQVVHWSNPIFGSVMDLEHRLDNILDDSGYLALSPETEHEVKTGWSIRYDYFRPSTVYLFCQYFCCIRLLQESLSFELFEKHQFKDEFFESVYAVGEKLSDYPLQELINCQQDAQVFNPQQRALGEAVTV
jgi:hypothetical protein